MDVSSLLSSLSSSLSPCRKLCCFHPSAQLESWGSASSTCPVCPSYVLVGHHDCSASLSLWEVSQPQGESYTVLGLSVAYLSHAHSCLPSHYPPKAVRCDSFLQLCCALCLFAERHFFFAKGFSVYCMDFYRWIQSSYLVEMWSQLTTAACNTLREFVFVIKWQVKTSLFYHPKSSCYTNEDTKSHI